MKIITAIRATTIPTMRGRELLGDSGVARTSMKRKNAV